MIEPQEAQRNTLQFISNIYRKENSYESTYRLL
jgi:hypothetical protein